MKLTRRDDELVLMVLNEKIKKQSSFNSHEKAAAGRIIWFDSRSWSCITLSYIWKNVSGFELLLAEPGPGLRRQRNNLREPTDLEQLCVWGKKKTKNMMFFGSSKKFHIILYSHIIVHSPLVHNLSTADAKWRDLIDQICLFESKKLRLVWKNKSRKLCGGSTSSVWTALLRIGQSKKYFHCTKCSHRFYASSVERPLCLHLFEPASTPGQKKR